MRKPLLKRKGTRFGLRATLLYERLLRPLLSRRKRAKRMRRILLLLAFSPLLIMGLSALAKWVEKLCALMGGITI